jgi:hypothetical protein
VGEDLAAKLSGYVARGGKLLLSYRAGLDPSGMRFAIPEAGVRLVGEAPYSPDFLAPGSLAGPDLPDTEHVMYQRGLQVEALPGATVLSQAITPYFNRTYRHFCSHRQTPSNGEIGYPGIVQKGTILYFAHPVFTQYNDNAPDWAKKLVRNAVNILLPEPLLRHTGPSTLQATVAEQASQRRQIVHLLHYIPERRGQAFDTIEDVIPLYDVTVSLRVSRAIRRVTPVPQGQPLAFDTVNGRVEFIVPRVLGHQMVEIG